jgi:hypothetical protein
LCKCVLSLSRTHNYTHTLFYGICAQESVRESIANHMAYAHQCVTEASVRFLEAFRRYNYT